MLKSCLVHFSLTLVLSALECQTGEVGTLLLVNPVGQNGLDHSGLLSEAAKVFGLRSRRLKLYLDQDLTQGKMKRLVDIILTLASVQQTLKLHLDGINITGGGGGKYYIYYIPCSLR